MSSLERKCIEQLGQSLAGVVDSRQVKRIVRSLISDFTNPETGRLDLDSLMQEVSGQRKTLLDSTIKASEVGPLNNLYKDLLVTQNLTQQKAAADALIDTGINPEKVLYTLITERGGWGSFAQSSMDRADLIWTKILDEDQLLPLYKNKAQGDAFVLGFYDFLKDPNTATDSPFLETYSKLKTRLLEPLQGRINQKGGLVEHADTWLFTENLGDSDIIQRGGVDQFVDTLRQIDFNREQLNGLKFSEFGGTQNTRLTLEDTGFAPTRATGSVDTYRVTLQGKTLSVNRKDSLSKLRTLLKDKGISETHLQNGTPEEQRLYQALIGESVSDEQYFRRVYSRLTKLGLQTELDEASNVTSLQRQGMEAKFTDYPKQLSQKSYLPFNDSTGLQQYLTAFAPEEALLEGLQSRIRSKARITGLVEALGPRPTQVFNQLSEHLQATKDIKGGTGIINNPKALMDQLTGEAFSDGNPTISKVSRNIVLATNLARLPGGLFTQFMDLGTFITLGQRYNGSDPFRALTKAAQMFIPKVENSATRSFALRTALTGNSATNAFMTNILNDFQYQNVSADQVGTWLEGANRRMNRINGMDWWSRWQRNFAGDMSTKFLGEVAQGKAPLSDADKALLTSYNLTEADLQKAFDPESGRVFWDTVEETDPDLSRRIHTFIYDSVLDVNNLPDYRTQAFRTAGLSRGSFFGEMAYITTLYKSFGMTLWTRTLPAINAEQGGVGLAKWLAIGMGLYFASDVARDLASGNTPKNYAENPTEHLLQAAATTGILSPLGVVDVSRVAESRDPKAEIAQQVLGPAWGFGLETADTATRVGRDIAAIAIGEGDDLKAGTKRRIGRASADVVDILGGAVGVPGATGLPYTKALFQYGLYDAIMETWDPDYRYDKEKYLYDTYGQEPLIQ